ncbi:hypothetical protein BHM03_00044115 [Ensete ventricosum]|nr:hypothetical protein BHM03_00044115 [Ensete ventricosum]
MVILQFVFSLKHPKDSSLETELVLGNLLVFFLLAGISLGLALDWLWFISKGR